MTSRLPGVTGGPYLGIDVGTSATRVSLIGSGGVQVASSGYPTHRGPAGMAEQDPLAWADALGSALRQIGISDHAPTAVGLCGQTPTLVLVDAAGRPVRPALTWQDTRAYAEATELASQLGDPEPLIGTPLPWSPANMPAKLLWLSRHEPSTRESTRWLLQPKDYLGLLLTGSPASDPWSSKGICRVTDNAPAAEVLEACGWAPAVCPPIGAAWQPRGTVSRSAADRFGLPAGIPVSIGWSDALAQTLAAGCFDRHSGFVFSGTSAIVGSPVTAEQPRAAGLFSVPLTCAPAPLLYGPTQSSGASVAWAARLIGCQAEDVPAIASTSAHGVPSFVPYLSGERAPLWNQDVRGLLLGLSEEHGPAEIARSVLTGILLSARNVLDIVEAASGSQIKEIEFVGRGAGDATWQALALETLGVTVRFHEDAEMSARGAAILAAVTTGVAMPEATRSLADQARIAVPGAAALERSQLMLATYRQASDVALNWLHSRPSDRRARSEEL